MYYFESTERQAELKAELDSWLGTPFRHFCGVKQGGCDCIHFVVRVLESLKAISPMKIKWYDRDWHLHRDSTLLYDNFKKHPDLEEVPLHQFINGDVILFQYGRAASHSAMYFAEEVYHSLTSLRVEKRLLKDPDFFKRMRHCFRVIA